MGSGSLVLKKKGGKHNQQTNKPQAVKNHPRSQDPQVVQGGHRGITWWFQPTPVEKIAQVKLDHFPKCRGKHTKI